MGERGKEEGKGRGLVNTEKGMKAPLVYGLRPMHTGTSNSASTI